MEYSNMTPNNDSWYLLWTYGQTLSNKNQHCYLLYLDVTKVEVDEKEDDRKDKSAAAKQRRSRTNFRLIS